VTGLGCLTEFIREPLELLIAREPDDQIYNRMSRTIHAMLSTHSWGNPSDVIFEAPSCQVVEFDWWNIHQGVVATRSEWRYLIRVMETDMAEPEKDLRKIIRIQQQVYAPTNFGW